MSMSKSRKKKTPATPTTDTAKSKKARKGGRAGLGMNNTWTDEPQVQEPAASAPEAEPVDQPTAEAAPAEPAEAPAPPAEPVASSEPPHPPTIEADVPAKKLSALDAAARVLAEEGRPMNCQELIEAMAAKDYWHSPGGKTPASTLYSAILREQKVKGDQARFAKATRGKFTRIR